MRTDLFVAMVAMCLIALQCTAELPPVQQTAPATTTTIALNTAADPAPPNGVGSVSARTTPHVTAGTSGGDQSTARQNIPADNDQPPTDTDTTNKGCKPNVSTGTSVSSTGSGASTTSTTVPGDSTTIGTSATGTSSTSTSATSTSATGTTDTGSTITSTTTTKMVDDVKPQQSANETSTAAITPVNKPPKAEKQKTSVEKKTDGSSSKSLVLAIAALVTFIAIAVAPV